MYVVGKEQPSKKREDSATYPLLLPSPTADSEFQCSRRSRSDAVSIPHRLPPPRPVCSPAPSTLASPVFLLTHFGSPLLAFPNCVPFSATLHTAPPPPPPPPIPLHTPFTPFYLHVNRFLRFTCFAYTPPPPLSLPSRSLHSYSLASPPPPRPPTPPAFPSPLKGGSPPADRERRHGARLLPVLRADRAGDGGAPQGGTARGDGHPRPHGRAL